MHLGKHQLENVQGFGLDVQEVAVEIGGQDLTA